MAMCFFTAPIIADDGRFQAWPPAGKRDRATIGQNSPAAAPEFVRCPAESCRGHRGSHRESQRGAAHVHDEPSGTPVIRNAVRALDPTARGLAQLARAGAAARGVERGRRCGPAAARPDSLRAYSHVTVRTMTRIAIERIRARSRLSGASRPSNKTHFLIKGHKNVNVL